MRTFLTRVARRSIAMILLATFAFAQANVAMAACGMERGELASVLVASGGASPCEGCGTVIEPGVQNVGLCVTHCTADLSRVSLVLAIVRAPGAAPVLAVVAPPPLPLHRSALQVPPPGTPPARVLQHAYLI